MGATVSNQSPPVVLFVSYAHEDRPWCDQLLEHLGWLRQAGQIEIFDDQQLATGERWEVRLQQELERANVIVLIVSSHFLNSRFCTTVELRRALEREADHTLRIVPIIADHCDWQALPLEPFYTLPQDEYRNIKPLHDWKDDVNRPLAAIARRIRDLTGPSERHELVARPPIPTTPPAVFQPRRLEWMRPEPPDRLVGRNEEVRHLVDVLTTDPRGHVVVFGPGGIGKTALTLQVATEPAVVRHFGKGRCLVRLESATSPQGLVDALHASLGLAPHSDPWTVIEMVLQERGEQPTLVVLDNLETPWEQDPHGIEQVLGRLAHLPNVTLLASIRGGEVPLRPNWRTRRELHRLEPPDARRLFSAIAPDVRSDDRLLPVVLTALDGVPLAIELFAAGAQGVSTLTLPWQRWRRERTAMLARGMTPDRLSNLDVSMRASLMGPRMNDCARCLFAMLGRLPSGVAFTDLESLLPGNGADAAMRLVQTRLGSEREGRLVMLGPVRDYARAQELSAEDLARLLAHFERLAAWLTVPFVLRGRDPVLKARAEIDNIDALIDGMLRDEDVPANTRYRLALLSLSVGDARMLLGGLPLAAIAYERTLAFVQRLAAADPANTTWQRDLSISGNRIGAVRQAQGDLAGALSAFEDSLVIRAQLAAAEPANTTWQRDLYICWDRIGEVRQRQGDLTGALRAFEDSRVIRARLAATDPANTTWQRDLSIGWSQIGDVLQRQGDLAGALRAFEDSRLIHAQLAAADPADTTCQRDLSICWSRIGEVRRRQGDFADALRAFEDSRVIAVRLAAADPANTTWQRDLSYCLTKLGEYHEQQGHLAEALRFAEESLGLDERLAALDPTNVTWKKDVEISRAQVARLRR